jgi:ABC-type transport system involved in cytochrome c biogenesis permease component
MLKLKCQPEAAAMMWYHLLLILLCAEATPRDPSRVHRVSTFRA